MSVLRFKALESLLSRKDVKVKYPSEKVSEYYGINVFNNDKMKEYLSKDAYTCVREAIDNGKPIDRKIADQISSGMRTWALRRGATHYTHWFHPLTGTTAEKHDAFFDFSDDKVIELFEGKNLIQQEPDASSLPSGGIRNTFEARGYTAWDPSSSAFVLDRTLCIPTIFVSYTGESLDYKTPLLKSLTNLDKAAVGVCQYFDKNVTKVQATLGWEQEYFLVDTALYNARPDLKLTGRTLMGHSSAKDQQLSDHYFGAIPKRVSTYIKDFEIQCYKLGIPIKTRHNEVAPNQYECAPIFEEANLAVDHNMLLMTVMKDVARRHNFTVLFHEKPYKNINGNGKHNNWSMSTNTGVNLLSPGKGKASKNIQFLSFLINTMVAVHEHSDLLRASIVSLGNESRLGASEAPPSIISVFLGKRLNEILSEIESQVTEEKMTPDKKAELKLDIGKIPPILLDNTDRNRTSPFAFTGNRFEFRAVGSSANCAVPMIVLNTIVADRLRKFKQEVDAIIEKGIKKDEAILQVLKKYIGRSKNIRFDGNGYSEEWVKEAEKRGLSNIKDVITAQKAIVSDSTIKLFKEGGIFSKLELEARLEINIEKYIKYCQIESRVLGDLAKNHIIPAVYRYQSRLIENVKRLKEIINPEEYENIAGSQLETIKEIAVRINTINQKTFLMIENRKEANAIENIEQRGRIYTDKVKPIMEEIRYEIDKLELMVDNEIWPLPKYRELLFEK